MTEKDNPNFVERFTVRMPDGMRDAIAERAKANGRSMNAEIVQILEEALDGKRVKQVQIGTNGGGPIVLDTSDIDVFAKGLKEFAEFLKSGKKKPT
ncbi:Arc family DNA-binding protein [Klebsiella aerogenes]|uniref:Arc family DNA-binding protein n=1 Tax=Klebsiella aerogenes TaxID=548 RepID=UPI002892F744|nr:Arc family DNA-binding protein [Klebsiella aerogenes]